MRRSLQLTISVVVLEDRHHIDQITVTQRDDLIPNCLVVLAWIEMGRAVSQVSPPSVVRENQVGPLKAAVCK